MNLKDFKVKGLKMLVLGSFGDVDAVKAYWESFPFNEDDVIQLHLIDKKTNAVEGPVMMSLASNMMQWHMENNSRKEIFESYTLMFSRPTEEEMDEFLTIATAQTVENE